jgi:hypothetical protein
MVPGNPISSLSDNELLQRNSLRLWTALSGAPADARRPPPYLSGIGLLASHLTEKNLEEILGKAVYRTKRQLEELVAELAPKPDAPPTIRSSPVLLLRPRPNFVQTILQVG